MLKRNITFIYSDSAEKAMYEPIAEEAKRRGYTVCFTDNKYSRCEIGFYCQHDNFPKYSKFSVVMLHDVLQQSGLWPDLWMYEAWDKYDIGILPSEQWVENWTKASMWYYSRPRLGTFLAGWPKADIISKIDTEQFKKEFSNQYNLDLSKKTVLYAPSWENDGKQDDFVQAMLKLDVNILIKQGDTDPEKYPDIARNIREMYDLHKNIKQVSILPPTSNICFAIAVCDVLVSEESSTMAEAAMLGKPAVSVSNWLIPDVTPSRLPICNFNFVSFTTREMLSSCVSDILNNYEFHKQKVGEYKKRNFANIGNSSTIIMDILDDALNEHEFRYKPLTPTLRKFVPPVKLFKHLKNDFYRQLNGDIKDNHRYAYNCIMKIKHLKRLLFKTKKQA